MTLLDANVLIAIAATEHEFHDAALAWLERGETFASTPITQGALVRFLIRNGLDGATAARVLGSIVDRPSHEFWADDLPFDEVVLGNVVGHAQVTDAYLIALARARRGRIVTFDRGLAEVAGGTAQMLAT